MVDRVYQRNASGSAPAAPAAPSIGYPTNGNPSQGVPATMPGEYWYYMITESLRRVIVDAGLVPDHLDMGLLTDAIQQAFTNRLADSTDAQDYQNDTLALSPASLIAGVLGSGSAGGNGYLPIPYRDAITGELKRIIIQWGEDNKGDLDEVFFPIAFPTRCLCVSVTEITVTGATASSVVITGVASDAYSPDSFVFRCLNDAGMATATNMNFFAIGE